MPLGSPGPGTSCSPVNLASRWASGGAALAGRTSNSAPSTERTKTAKSGRLAFATMSYFLLLSDPRFLVESTLFHHKHDASYRSPVRTSENSILLGNLVNRHALISCAALPYRLGSPLGSPWTAQNEKKRAGKMYH